ncbi:hypothetical protein [Streptomyces sp. NPDC006879]|uniref:hypothetical protein n=1 Tax=Streptomyces sp. NPDC006879 TaxID=3364767 RepID=UPI0036A57941
MPLELTASSFASSGMFGEPSDSFCLITTEESGGYLHVQSEQNGRYARVLSLSLPPGQSLGELLAQSVPPEAHVLAVCPGRFLDSPTPRQLGRRKLAVMPAGSTPLGAEQIQYYLRSALRVDPQLQARTAEDFFEQVGASARLTISDDSSGTEAEFDHTVGECVWNQQAGPLEAGEQQIFPAGKLSVTADEITTFSPHARLLGLNGKLTMHGWPVVHRHADPADTADQQKLFDALSVLVSHPVTLDVAAGVVEGVTPTTPGGRPAAEALQQLLEDDPRYRVVWELGFGINATTEVLPANCGPNEVYGGPAGCINLGLGITPTTRFALAFLCRRSSLLTSDGAPVLGQRKAVRRGRMQRTSSASCGCH